MSRYLAVILNFIVPGTGLILRGHWKLACKVQLALLTATLSLCWSRWVFEPIFIGLFLGLTFVIYLISSAFCFSKLEASRKSPGHALLLSCIFMIVCLSGLAVGFVFKQHWLGVHVYFVPSMSMHPTLNPGQFILLDTWAYRNKSPSLDDVVVFEHGVKKQHLIKRINHWPNGDLTKNNLWYVIGDNKRASLDSRYYGGISAKQLIGEVKLILFTINRQQQLQFTPGLKAID